MDREKLDRSLWEEGGREGGREFRYELLRSTGAENATVGKAGDDEYVVVVIF